MVRHRVLRALRTAALPMLALAAAVLVAYAQPGNLATLLPGNNGVAGWAMLNADTAANKADELYKIYDGDDGRWKTAGVTRAYQRYYKNGQTNKVCRVIINQTGTEWQKAKALYGVEKGKIDGLNTFHTFQAGKEACFATANGSTTGHCWAKYYYFSVQINGTTEAELNACKQFLTAVANKVNQSG